MHTVILSDWLQTQKQTNKQTKKQTLKLHLIMSHSNNSLHVLVCLNVLSPWPHRAPTPTVVQGRECVHSMCKICCKLKCKEVMIGCPSEFSISTRWMDRDCLAGNGVVNG